MPAAIREEYHVSKWRSVAVWRGGYWGYFRHACVEVARLSLTLNVISLTSIDALRKVHSSLMLGVPSQLDLLAGQEHGRTISLRKSHLASNVLLQ